MVIELAPGVKIEDTYWLPSHSATICCETPDDMTCLLFQYRPEWKCWSDYPSDLSYVEDVEDVSSEHVQRKLGEFAAEYDSKISPDYVKNVENHIKALMMGVIEPGENDGGEYV